MTVNEKMTAYGVEGLTDIELMKIIIPSEKAADRVMCVLDSCAGFGEAYGKLSKVPGVSDANAAKIAAMLELAGRRNFRKAKPLSTPDAVYREIRHLAYDDQERFIVVGLNGAHEAVLKKVVTVGLVNRTMIHPREVFADAIKNRCTAIFIAHNHPTGVLDPSSEDISATSRLFESGELLGIKVLDHLIISPDGYFSFKEHGMM